MQTIQYRPSTQMKSGCLKCKYHSKCSLSKCNMPVRYSYGGSDLLNDYNTFTRELNVECYVRKYRNGYILITHGDKYRSGETDSDWCIKFYHRDMSSKGYSVSGYTEEDVIEKNGKMFLYNDEYNRYNYGLSKLLPLKNSKVILY